MNVLDQIESLKKQLTYVEKVLEDQLPHWEAVEYIKLEQDCTNKIAELEYYVETHKEFFVSQLGNMNWFICLKKIK